MSKFETTLEKHHEIVEQSITHVKRGKRIVVEFSSVFLELSKLINATIQYMPYTEQVELQQHASKIVHLLDEYGEYMKDYCKDLVDYGNIMVELFEALIEDARRQA